VVGRAGPLVWAAYNIKVHLYYESRNAPPRPARAFIDMAVELFSAESDFLLSGKELAASEAAWRKNIAKCK
jgi:hypothetical protein